MQKSLDKTYLAIDYGTKRIGLAKSDPTGTISSALKTIEVKSMADAVKKVMEIVKEYEPNALVIGYPLLDSGDKSQKCLEIDVFVQKLAELYKGKIHKVDESYSSQDAAGIVHAHGKKTGRNKPRLDRLAAVIILQRFLDGETQIR